MIQIDLTDIFVDKNVIKLNAGYRTMDYLKNIILQVIIIIINDNKQNNK